MVSKGPMMGETDAAWTDATTEIPLDLAGGAARGIVLGAMLSSILWLGLVITLWTLW